MTDTDAARRYLEAEACHHHVHTPAQRTGPPADSREQPLTSTDEDLRTRIEGMLGRLFDADASVARVTVDNGVVGLTGQLEWRHQVGDAEKLIRALPGVVDVANRLDFVWDDRPGGRRFGWRLGLGSW